MLYSCNREMSNEVTEPMVELNSKMVALGKKLENPYSVENMSKALYKLKNNDAFAKNISEDFIKTSHLYIKFNPKTEEELSRLKLDSTLVLYPYPLDYEIPVTLDYVINTIEDIVPYYAAVPVDKQLPVDIEYEILERLFIPDEEKDVEDKASKINKEQESFVQRLVDKSLELTGNIEGESVDIEGRRSSWRPAGRITMEDNDLRRNVGVEGLRVRARRWFTTHTGIVDANGYYTCDGTFKRPANYTFDWERYDFKIRGVMRGVDGPKKTGNWDIHFAKGSRENFCATIFRAAHHYYYKDILNLRRPPQSGFWRTQLKIKALFETNNDSHGDANPFRNTLGLGNWVRIYNPHRASAQIYGTTIHELAHASHWNLSKSFSFSYLNTSDVVAESWACGVQWALTRMVYPHYDRGYYSRRKYTAVVRDLIDGYKMVVSDKVDGMSGNIEKSYRDNISGYNIRQIEDALVNSTSWNVWKNRIINDPSMYDNHIINSAFLFWNNPRNP